LLASGAGYDLGNMARLVSLAVLTALIVFLGIIFFQVIAPFVLPLFLAGVLAILCQPIFQWFHRRTGGRMHAAAGLTTVLVLSMFLIPVTAGTILGTRQLYRLAQSTSKSPQLQKVIESIGTELEKEHLLARIESLTGEKLEESELQKINELFAEGQTRFRNSLSILAQKTVGVAGSALSILGDAFALFVSLLIFVIAFYYFLADGPNLLEGAQQLIPVHQEYQRQLLVQFNQVVRAVVLATFLAAIAQGLATGIGLYFCGFSHFLVVTLVASLMSLVPFVGTWLIWGPAAAWLAWTGHTWSALFLVVYGLAFVGTIDNVIRTYVLNSNVKLHPLLAFVSVLGGLQVMGLWGVFIGPIVASCLYALVKIFNTELLAYSQERLSQAQVDAGLRQLGALPAVVVPIGGPASPALCAPSGSPIVSRSEPGGLPGQPVPASSPAAPQKTEAIATQGTSVPGSSVSTSPPPPRKHKGKHPGSKR